jgi:hypothetical protein
MLQVINHYLWIQLSPFIESFDSLESAGNLNSLNRHFVFSEVKKTDLSEKYTIIRSRTSGTSPSLQSNQKPKRPFIVVG